MKIKVSFLDWMCNKRGVSELSLEPQPRAKKPQRQESTFIGSEQH